MIVVSKRNIILPGPNGEAFHMPRDYMGPVPDWAEKSAYFQALVSDGKIIVSAGKASGGKGKGAKKSSAPQEDPPKEDQPQPDPPAGDSGDAE